ncbi:hypothetical protein TcCL_ESM11048 [Trypanosoma cruzi]|uniref:Uncharacterized protein n=1 Tax=Trypanosoma cruzi (strain CL Brener) TaxID=353153 RepID=Q4D4K8_TRYCC|nr:hypothetical protein Tc00.1047053511541.20 [Trypanosoma cruzi]EAN87458.1 hypothetical protein Tc00.1047053511541.20 [Trypanosoma cruzi]RNC51801.1 hypothetical protein TcCL_ESM11048 [Trypanosoma cruzi]|eukprot:XP_809309.1 hypothetical protein [Trypanosoma cruzi strain CL Brener]
MEDAAPQLGWRQENASISRKEFDCIYNSFLVGGDDNGKNEHNNGQSKDLKKHASGDLSKNNFFFRLEMGLVGLASCLNTLSNITVHQKSLLGLSTDATVPELSFVNEKTSSRGESVIMAPKDGHTATSFSKVGNSTCEFSTCTILDDPESKYGEMGVDAVCPKEVGAIAEARINATDLESFEFTQERIFLERDHFSLTLAEMEKEMDDLKNTYEQKISLLHDEIRAFQDMMVKLREVEKAHHLESVSAVEKNARYEEEIMTLRKPLAISTEKELSPKAKMESVEKNDESRIKSLEDALAVTTRMNIFLLENAESRDAAYFSAVKEIDNLRGKLTQVRDETRHGKELYEEKIKALEGEILFLKPFEERVALLEEKLLRCSQQENLVVKSEEEIRQLRSALREADSLVVTLKQECAVLSAGMNQTGTIDNGICNPSNATIHNNARASDNFDFAEGSSRVMTLTREIGLLKKECNEYRDALETLKQDHSFETEFLTARLLKAESGLLAFPPKNESPTLQRGSRAMCDAATQAVVGNDDMMGNLGEKSESGKMGQTPELWPPILVELSPRVKVRNKGINK